MTTGVQKLAPQVATITCIDIFEVAPPKKRRECSHGNLSLGGIVYLVIPGCIRSVNSDYFKFDKVYL